MKKRTLNIKKTAGVIIVLSTIQNGLFIAFILYEYFFRKTIGAIDVTLLYLFAAILIFSNAGVTIRDALLLNRADSQYQTLQKTLSQVKDLHNEMRAQRHDFMNHLQVVHGLIEMDEYREANQYLERVYTDIQKINRILKTTNPALNALLQAKLIDCDQRGITADLRITSNLEALPIPDWEFCRVLGNLIDNAIDALEEKELPRKICVELFEELKAFGFRITNNGPAIPEKDQKTIFEVGFTTKGNHGEGMGLAIVREIMAEYGGRIELQSHGDITVFQGWIPKNTPG